ncbi:MAG TPA: glycerol-3-phosphate 1-O-acyltransferase PlsY, partial [Bryobacteraceae bacterium]|nr:glycerol-3-phosphate 1-O-acyltransferase PlsY [Bryobacteraceae bacterium]
SMGSGNIGATNVLRTSGRAAGIATLILDALKGTFAVWLMHRVTNGSPLWTSLAAAAVVLGHVFPVFLKFKGGKAVATFAGAFAVLTPLPLLATLIVFVATVAATRYVSLGSVIGAICFPLAVFLINHPPAPVLMTAIAACALVIYRHRSNLQRVRAGTENALSFGRKTTGGGPVRTRAR